MQTTDYFRDEVMVKRPYIKTEWIELALKSPVKKEVQANDEHGRHWRSEERRVGKECSS